MAETLGSLLRRKRESLGLSLEKAAGFTRIRVKHLEAIESDDISSIPSVPQARGFIRNYASFLGFRPEEVEKFIGAKRPRPAKTAKKAKTAPPADSPPADRTGPPASSTKPRVPLAAPVIARSAEYAKPRPGTAAYPKRNWLRFDWILGAAVTVALLGFLGWGGYYAVMSITGPATPTSNEPFIPLDSPSPSARMTEDLALTSAPDGTSPAETASGERTPDATGEESPAALPGTLTVPAPSPTAFPTPLGGVYTDVRIHIMVLQRAYLEVKVDGQTSFAGRVLAGETYDFIGRQTVSVSTGNGAGIRVVFNGVDEGALGRFGELVERTYTPTGPVEPSPEPTSTPTVTRTPTRTTNP